MKSVLRLRTAISLVMLGGIQLVQPASAAELHTLKDESGLGQLVALLSVLATLEKGLDKGTARSTESTTANRGASPPWSCTGPMPCQLHQPIIDRSAAPTTGPGWW